jgi:peptidoglycan biosynthesis protein MviN/MurJ (putative lipid II flippase)
MVEWLGTTYGKHWIVLIILYFLAQFIFLFIYLNQDHLYDHLHKQKFKFYIRFILQIHIFIMASTYIMQWVAMWTIWDRYTSGDWLLMLIVSLAALLAVIALMGHPCDLVCAPFILSYDSTEYNIRIGSPFLTEKVKN